MATLGEIARILGNFDAIDAFDAAMLDSKVEDAAIAANIDQTKNKGELATGKKISPNYTPNYQKYYKKGSRTKPTPDLYQTGDRNKSLQFVNHKRGEVTIDSPVPYSEHLEERYSKEINGVQDKNIGKVNKVALPIINKDIKKQLKL